MTYQESLPEAGTGNVNYSDGDFSNLSTVDQGGVQKLYAVKHNPFVYLPMLRRTSIPATASATP
jgi:hypothetical protein